MTTPPAATATNKDMAAQDTTLHEERALDPTVANVARMYCFLGRVAVPRRKQRREAA
ncbi:hypothetical protein [Nonomuraea sp. SYSU D8015]|uniref:hypothetical protein n=1 Tax=Nonomuraea sp. SYSU D8015 TaxID=2593644 RepID=UPI0016604531|nr:hypothetical protein [Nonomuraea sp. SYSU D8015]